MELAIDEVILQIRKNNQEAVRLLFSLFEKHFIVIEKKFINSGTTIGYMRSDLRSIVLKETLDALKLYEFDKSNFFSYWKLIVSRRFYNHFESLNNEAKIFKNIYQIDEVFENTFSNEVVPINKYELHDVYNDCLKIIKDENGEEAQNIIILWSEGYSYQEIAHKVKMSINQVTYIINKSIKRVKELKVKKIPK